MLDLAPHDHCEGWHHLNAPTRLCQELKFIYLTSDSRQLYTEIYSKDLQEGMQLTLTKASQEGKMEHSPLWATFLRAGREGRMQPPGEVLRTHTSLGKEQGVKHLSRCVSQPPVFN